MQLEALDSRERRGITVELSQLQEHFNEVCHEIVLALRAVLSATVHWLQGEGVFTTGADAPSVLSNAWNRLMPSSYSPAGCHTSSAPTPI